MSAKQKINKGDYCRCVRGIIGRVYSIKRENGRLVYRGVTQNGGNWQSVNPTKLIAADVRQLFAGTAD